MTALVVALRWGGDPGPAETLAKEVRGAMDRAAVAGGRLVGVSADGASFGFEQGAFEEAIELAVAFAQEGPRFCVGVAAGELAAVREEDAFERLSVGSAAARALALARVAAPGEVLVDAKIREAESGSLLSIGRRVATLAEEGGKRLRGLVLDVNEPFRRAGSVSVEHVHEPRVVGREASLAMIESVEPGGVAIVRAPAGVGGSRFLEEMASRAARALLVEPRMCAVEPLGALRVAFARAADAKRALHGKAAELLDALDLGVGLDIDGASDLVRAWLEVGSGTTVDERAWVLIDDASHVDRATLEAIGHAASVPGVPFAVVVRLDPGDVLPSSLATLVVEADVPLKALQPHEATAVLEEACGGKANVSPEVVRRWVRRGAGVPLAILEGLRHGLTVGELAVRSGLGGSTIVARSRTSGRGRALSAHAWISRRLAVVDADRPSDALVLSAVAIAGPWVAARVVEEAVVDLGLPAGPPFQETLERLIKESFLARRGDLVAPTSRTLRETAIERLDDGLRRRIHAALAGAILREAHGLDLAEGAHHAALAGDHLGAAALAMRAADRARKAGLDTFAESLSAFARAEGVAQSPTMTTPAPPPNVSESLGPPSAEVVSLPPEELEEEAPSTVRTPPPPSLGRDVRTTLGVENLTTGQIAALPAPPSSAMPTTSRTAGAKPSSGGEVAFDTSVPFETPAAFVMPRVPAQPAFARGADSPRREGVAELAAAARRALAAGDHVALDAALAAIEVVGGSTSAIARLRGIAALAGGRVAEGLTLVRNARERAKTPAELSRSTLACAIALGVAGDRDGAMIEAVTALAVERRETGGPAQACRRVVELLAQV